MSYTGTKSYNSTFRDARNLSESGQVVLLTGLISDTNYSIVVTATNTAGFRNSSDPEFGITLTGRKLPPSPPLLHISTSNTNSSHVPPIHHHTCTHNLPFLPTSQSSSHTDNFSSPSSTSTTPSSQCSPNFTDNRTTNLHTHNYTWFQLGWTNQVRVNSNSLL